MSVLQGGAGVGGANSDCRSLVRRGPRVFEEELGRADRERRERAVFHFAGADHEEAGPQLLQRARVRRLHDAPLHPGAPLERFGRLRRVVLEDLEQRARVGREARGQRRARKGRRRRGGSPLRRERREHRLEHSLREQRRPPLKPLRVDDRARLGELAPRVPQIDDPPVTSLVPLPAHRRARMEHAPERFRLRTIADGKDEQRTMALYQRDRPGELHAQTLPVSGDAPWRSARRPA